MSAWSALTPGQRVVFQRVTFDEVAAQVATREQARRLQVDAFMHTCDWEGFDRPPEWLVRLVLAERPQ